jgi:hypothetical protein
MLEDVCLAVEATVGELVGNDGDLARTVIGEFPRVLDSCDGLEFNDLAQALAYLVIHLPDRYCRLFQVLERLLVDGRLPVGKNEGFAAIDIGAGPGPGIFAVRAFYAALSHYVARHYPSWRIVPLGRSDVVERGKGMHRVMHHFAEALTAAEQGLPVVGSPGPSPCLEVLRSSSTPFGARFDDFTRLDVRAEHHQARQEAARELYEDDDLQLSLEGARRLAYTGPATVPSGYALGVMMNFLTPGSNAMSLFSGAVDRLLTSALVPGGTILVLGGRTPSYREIYQELDRRAATAHLTTVDGFNRLLQAGHRADERKAVRELTWRLWDHLASLAGDVSQVQGELREIKADKIFDRTRSFGFAQFQVRAYRQGA